VVSEVIPAVSHVVWFALDGALIPARVIALSDTSPTRYLTIDGQGEERTLSRRRILWTSAMTVASYDALPAYLARVIEARSRCDLPALWERLASDEALTPLSVSDAANLCGGAATAPSMDALVLAVFEERLHFKMRDGMMAPVSREMLAKMVAEREEAAQQARDLAQVLDLLRQRLDSGTAVNAPPSFAQTMRRHLDALVTVALAEKPGDADPLGRTLLRDLLAPRGGDASRQARELLVRLGEFAEDENIFVRKAGVSRTFAAEVLEEAACQASTDPRQRRPVDMRGLLTLAIDDPETTEVDDAFAMEGDTLHVFISDVAARVTRGSLVEREAAARMTTIYLPDGRIPMVPPVLADDALSLKEGVDRPCLAYSFQVNADGLLSGFMVREALIRVNHQLGYVETDRVLSDAADSAAEISANELIRDAARLMDRHRDRRLRMGALAINRQEFRIDLDEERGVSIRTLNASSPARELVAEMMVAVCAGAATWCVDQSLPCIFRVQPTPDNRQIPKGTEITDPAERIAVLRQLKPTSLTTRPGSHFTLGVDCYTQVTSPIRRFHDLLMNYQIKWFIGTGSVAIKAAEINGQLETFKRLSTRARRVEQDTRRFWCLRYMEQNRAQILRGTIIRPLAARWLVELTDLGIQVPFRPRFPVSPGEEVRLTIVEVDAQRGRVVLELSQ